LDINEEKLVNVTSYFKELTKEMIYNALAASLDRDGQIELARQMGLLNENTYRAMNAIDLLTATYDTNGDGVIDVTERTKEYYDALAKVISTSGTHAWNFVVTTNSIVAPGGSSYEDMVNQGMITAPTGASTKNGGVYTGVKDLATGKYQVQDPGGSFSYTSTPPLRDSGGPGYAGQAYVITPKATPEVFIPKTDGQFYPNAKLGGNTTINIYVPGAGDPRAVAKAVMKELELNAGRKF
jgi:hypothetical protein